MQRTSRLHRRDLHRTVRANPRKSGMCHELHQEMLLTARRGPGLPDRGFGVRLPAAPRQLEPAPPGRTPPRQGLGRNGGYLSVSPKRYALILVDHRT